MTIDDVVGRVAQYGCDLVEITGGEPLLQRDVYPLMKSCWRLEDGDGGDWRALEHQGVPASGDPDHGCEVSGQRRVRKTSGRISTC